MLREEPAGSCDEKGWCGEETKQGGESEEDEEVQAHAESRHHPRASRVGVWASRATSLLAPHAPYRLVPMASSSSMKMMDGAFSLASAKASRTSLAPSPMNICTSWGPASFRKVAWGGGDRIRTKAQREAPLTQAHPAEFQLLPVSPHPSQGTHLGLRSTGPGQQGLPRAWGPVHQHPLWGLDP